MKEFSALEDKIADAISKGLKLEIHQQKDYLKNIFLKLIAKRTFGIWEDVLDPELIKNSSDHKINYLITRYNKIYHTNFISHLQIMISMNDAFKLAGIHYVLLKGSALRISSYKFGFMRFTRDIDVLIKEKDLNRAYEVLKRLGFKYTDRYCNDSASGSLGYARHLPKLKNINNIVIEIHHRISDPKTQSICKLSQKMLLEYDVIKFNNIEFNIPRKEHIFAHLINHELTQKKENNLILLASDLKNLLKCNMQSDKLMASLEDLKIDMGLIININLRDIDIPLIKKYKTGSSLSLYKRLKFLNHQISYEYQIPIKNIKFSTYLNHFKIKVLRKLRFKYH